MGKLKLGLLLVCNIMLTACGSNANSSEDGEPVQTEEYSTEKDSNNSEVESVGDDSTGNSDETGQADDSQKALTKETDADKSDEPDTIYLKPCNTYQDILDNAYTVITNPWAIIRTDDIFDSTGLWEAGMGSSTDEALARIGYTFYDVDGNGIEELIIVDTRYHDGGPEEWDNRILLMYSLSDDKPVLLIAGVVRGRYYLLDDNTIYHEGSDGAAYSVCATYRMAKDGVSLETIDFYYSGYRDDSVKGYELIEGNWGWFHNTAGSKSSESEWVGSELPREIQEIDREQVKELDLTFFEEMKQ